MTAIFNLVSTVCVSIHALNETSPDQFNSIWPEDLWEGSKS